MIENNKEYLPFDIHKLLVCANNSNVLVLDEDFLMLDNLKEEPVCMSEAEAKLGPSQAKDYVVIVCAEGTFNIRVNWKVLELGQYEILIVRPGDICQFRSITNCRLMLTSFSDAFSVQKVDSKISMLFMQYISNMASVKLTGAQYEKIVEVYMGMRKLLEMPNFYYKEMALNGVLQVCSAFACQWICEVTENKKKKDVKNNYSSQQKLFDQFLELVVQYHDKERSVMFYANKLCITPKYLSQVVVKVSGRYAVDIIRDQVIFKAKALLRSRQYTVQQVAGMLSFPNPSFFGKYFRQEVGVSPRQYMIG